MIVWAHSAELTKIKSPQLLIINLRIILVIVMKYIKYLQESRLRPMSIPQFGKLPILKALHFGIMPPRN